MIRISFSFNFIGIQQQRNKWFDAKGRKKRIQRLSLVNGSIHFQLILHIRFEYCIFFSSPLYRRCVVRKRFSSKKPSNISTTSFTLFFLCTFTFPTHFCVFFSIFHIWIRISRNFFSIFFLISSPFSWDFPLQSDVSDLWVFAELFRHVYDLLMPTYLIVLHGFTKNKKHKKYFLGFSQRKSTTMKMRAYKRV